MTARPGSYGKAPIKTQTKARSSAYLEMRTWRCVQSSLGAWDRAGGPAEQSLLPNHLSDFRDQHPSREERAGTR